MTTTYKGGYSDRYVLDQSAVTKKIQRFPAILGPEHKKFYNIDIEKTSSKYVIFLLKAHHQFISKSKYGNVRYDAFNYSREIKVQVSNFNSRDIENHKRNIKNKESQKYYGKRHYYTSPAGRRISRILQVRDSDFIVSVKKILEIHKPKHILVKLKSSPKKVQDIVSFHNEKICVKCFSRFQTVKWGGWDSKYLLPEGVYNCKNCNPPLEEAINAENNERNRFGRKELIISSIFLGFLILYLTLKSFIGNFSLLFLIPTVGLSIVFLSFYYNELKRRKRILKLPIEKIPSFIDDTAIRVKLKSRLYVSQFVMFLIALMLIVTSILTSLSYALYFAAGFVLLYILFWKLYYIRIQHRINLVEIYYVRNKSSEIKDKLSRDRLKGLEIKFDKLEVYLHSLSRQFRGSDFHFFEEESRILGDLKQNFTSRTDTLLGRLEESDLFGKIDKFLLDPNLVGGAKLLDVLSEKISICENNQFLKLLKKFKTSNQNVNQTYKKLDELFEKLKILEDLILKNEFAHVMEKLPTYENQIINIKSTELSSKFSEISVKTQEGLNKFQFEMQKLIDKGEKLMLDNDYSGARSNVNKAKIIYEKSIKSTKLEVIKQVNFPKIFESIENKEQEFTVYKILIEFADRFSRVLLLEIINKSNLDPGVVEPIVKNLISCGKIRAKFDDETKGIEFKFAVDEIDALMKVYGDWETRDKGKKE